MIPGKIKLKTACVSSFSKKINDKPLDTIICKSRNSNISLSLTDIGRAQYNVIDYCLKTEEADDNTVEVELLRLFGRFCKSSSFSSFFSSSSSNIFKKLH